MEAREIWGILGKLGLAVLLGGVVGWQRETLDRPAGLRTNVLVCVGSTVYMLVSQSFGPPADPSRVASQVATGMGFLGAGTIIRHGSIVRGLTTAAGLWTVAAIGLCVGRGGMALIVACLATAVVLVTLTLLSEVERRIIGKRQYRLVVLRAQDGRSLLPAIQERLGSMGVQVQATEIGEWEADRVQEVRLTLRIPPGLAAAEVTNAVTAMEAVRGVMWE